MKRHVSALMALIFGCGGILSARADSLGSAAAEFAGGNYEAAARDYESALAAKGPSAGLYYDLGLAQRKAGQNVSALLSFRRALLLNPRMPEARAAVAELESTLAVPSRRPDWRDWVAAHVPLQIVMAVSTVFGWLGLFLILILAFSSGKRPGLGFLSILFAVLGIAAAAACVLSDPRFSAHDMSVVISSEAAALRSAPADQSETVSQVAPGGVLRVLSRRGIWTYCESPDGLKGWLSTSQIEPLVPGAGV